MEEHENHIEMPEACHVILDKLNQAGEEAFIVGGCVRDALLGRKPEDWDMCTSAVPERIMEIFSDYRVIPTGIEHGTVTVLVDHRAFEVTTYRIDGEYKDHRRPEQVMFTTRLADDLSRRDFTVNAMAYHPQTGLVDIFHGRRDLKNRVIRAVGEPKLRFEEDGLRILRLVRFATVLDFDYEAETYQAAKEKAHLMQHVSAERIQTELNKILVSDHVATGLYMLKELNLYSYFAPVICHIVSFEQNNKAHFLDVFEHTCLATGLIDNELVLRLTMLLHDVGKSFTWQEDSDTHEDRFPHHELIGAEVANKLLRDLKYDNKTRKEVVKLIAHHNDVLLPEKKIVRKALAELGAESLRRLIKVKVADILAHAITYEERLEVVLLFKEIETILDGILARKEAYRIDMLALKGKDLLDMGFVGAEIGTMQHKLLAYVLEHPESNQKETLKALIEAKEV